VVERLPSSIDSSPFVVTPSGSKREIVNMSGRESAPFDVLRSNASAMPQDIGCWRSGARQLTRLSHDD
jgi:hypothetical protein